MESVALLNELRAESSKPSPLTLISAFVCAVLVIAGNAATIVSINFWLQELSDRPGAQLAILGVTNALYAFIFLATLAAYAGRFGCAEIYAALRWNGRSGWAPRARMASALAAVGFLDIAENFVSLYATPATPVILQALLQCTIPFFTLLQSVAAIPGERKKNFRSPFLAVAMLLLVCGVIVASWESIASATAIGRETSQVCWILVYVLSCAIYGSWSVSQRVCLDRLAVNAASTEAPSTARTTWRTSVLHKITLLAGDTCFQLLFTFALLPFDALPWFGGSASVSDTWSNFSAGVTAIFASKASVSYGAIFSAGYILTYFGEVWLTEHSPTLSTIVLQASSPVTAVLLMVAPVLNVQPSAGGATMWVTQVSGFFLLLGATVMYELWERRQVLSNAAEPDVE